MKNIKKIMLFLFSCIFFLNTPLYARNGGAIAGGVLGGMVLGSAITAASQPRYYYDDRPRYSDRYDEGYSRGKHRATKEENEKLRRENEQLRRQRRNNAQQTQQNKEEETEEEEEENKQQ